MHRAPAIAPGPSPSGNQRWPQLDGLRGMAILLVLIWHYFINHANPAPGTLPFAFLKSLWPCSTGVDLFFVLSGFLLGGLLLEHADSPRYFSTFYLRRAVRILPIYFLVLILFYLGRALVPAATNAGTDLLFDGTFPWWSYFTFTQNFFMAQAGNFGAPGLAVTWSLAIEEQFYLILPLLLRFVPGRWLTHVLVASILAAPLGRLGLVWFQDPTGAAGFLFMPARADSLLCGVLAAQLLRERKAGDRPLPPRGRTYLLFGGALLFTLGLGVLGNWYSRVTILLLGHTWFAFFYAFAIVLAMTDPAGPISRLLQARALRWLGLISYGVYLLHPPVLMLMHGFFEDQFPALHTGKDALLTTGALVVTLLLAALSWFYFEQPFIKLGRRTRY